MASCHRAMVDRRKHEQGKVPKPPLWPRHSCALDHAWPKKKQNEQDTVVLNVASRSKTSGLIGPTRSTIDWRHISCAAAKRNAQTANRGTIAQGASDIPTHSTSHTTRTQKRVHRRETRNQKKMPPPLFNLSRETLRETCCSSLQCRGNQHYYQIT